MTQYPELTDYAHVYGTSLVDACIDLAQRVAKTMEPKRHELASASPRGARELILAEAKRISARAAEPYIHDLFPTLEASSNAEQVRRYHGRISSETKRALRIGRPADFPDGWSNHPRAARPLDPSASE